MKNYVKTFPNPILALAFKEGVDFVGDPDYKALEPKRDGDIWEVIVEHDVDDDEDIYKSSARNQPAKAPLAVINPEPAPPVKAPMKEWIEQQSKRINDMQHYNAKVNKGEIIKLPVKPVRQPVNMVDESVLDDIEPCNSCLNCSHGDTCINIINAACAATM